MRDENNYTMRMDICKNGESPDKPKIRIETVDELFQLLTSENFERIMKGVKMTFDVALATKNVMQAEAKSDAPLHLRCLEISEDEF